MHGGEIRQPYENLERLGLYIQIEMYFIENPIEFTESLHLRYKTEKQVFIHPSPTEIHFPKKLQSTLIDFTLSFPLNLIVVAHFLQRGSQGQVFYDARNTIITYAHR